MKLTCPACKCDFDAEYIGLHLSRLEEGVLSVVEGKLVIDFSRVSMQNAYIHSVRCCKCGEFVYHERNLPWGQFDARSNALRNKEEKYAELPRPSTIDQRGAFSDLLALIKENPEALGKLQEAVKEKVVEKEKINI